MWRFLKTSDGLIFEAPGNAVIQKSKQTLLADWTQNCVNIEKVAFFEN